MIDVERKLVYDERTCETHLVLTTKFIAGIALDVPDCAPPSAIELLSAKGANMLVDDVIEHANGFNLLPLERET